MLVKDELSSFLSSPINLNENLKEQIEKKLEFSFLQLQEQPESVSKLLKFLEVSGFYTSPASTRFHENYAGGLAEHSVKVANTAFQLYTTGIWNDVQPAEIWVAALLHDICKVEYYKEVKKKNWNTGVYEVGYEIAKDRPYLLGHGEQSCILLLKHLPGTSFKILEAIRWHMGLWDCSNQREFGESFGKNQLVSLILTADSVSSTDWFLDVQKKS